MELLNCSKIKKFNEVDRSSKLLETTDCILCNMLGVSSSYYIATFMLCIADWLESESFNQKTIDLTYPIESFTYFLGTNGVFNKLSRFLSKNQIVFIKTSLKIIEDNVTNFNLIHPSVFFDIKRIIG